MDYSTHWWWRVRVYRTRRAAIRMWWLEYDIHIVYGSLVFLILLFGVVYVVTYM